jgi:tol-pal system protein YbgF
MLLNDLAESLQYDYSIIIHRSVISLREVKPMKRFMLKTALAVLVLCSIGAASGQGFRLSQPDEAGGFIAAMHPHAVTGSGIKSSAMGPGLDLFIRYKLSPNFMVSTGTGIYTMMDKSFSWDQFKTTLFPTFETKFYLMPSGNRTVVPMALAGLQVYGWKNSFKDGAGTIHTSDKTSYDAAFFFGAGLQFAVNEKTSFIVSGDYRYQFTSEGSEKPKFWAFKAGLAFALNKPNRSFSKQDEIEYTMGEQELATLDDMFKEDSGKGTGKGGDEDALSLLFQPEQGAASGTPKKGESETGSGTTDQDLSSLFGAEESGSEVTPASAEQSSTYPDTEIGQLMAKVDRIKTDLDHKSEQVDQLQAKVDALGPQGGAASGGSPLADDEFKSRYESARSKFQMKSYGEAISALQALSASNPTHMLASNCHYWMGECYNAMGDYRKAIAEFQTVLQYRRSYKFADALIMSGLCYLKIGETATARNKFQELIDRYPESEYAPKAMRYLGSL